MQQSTNEEETEAWMIETNLEFVSKQPVSVNETNKDVIAMYQRYGHIPIGQGASSMPLFHEVSVGFI